MTRQTATSDIYVDGKTYKVSVIENPNVDDVLITEAQIHARAVSTGESVADRRVERSLRDYLVRFGVGR